MHFINSLTEPLSLQVRLEDGETPHTGRVGIRFGNVWGTLCNKYLHMNDAKVICRMLGYFGVNHLYELPGNGTIWLSKLGCNGTERSIDKCNHSEWGQTDTCNHMNDVAITCKIGKKTYDKYVFNVSAYFFDNGIFVTTHH